ncbi:MAG: ABC transporter ATP-binding protein, partial [Myxococcota bacterium]
SAGEAQRVAVAAALARRVTLLVLDEPSASLDAESEALIGVALRAAATHAAVVVVSHREALARLADRVVRLEGGRIAE